MTAQPASKGFACVAREAAEAAGGTMVECRSIRVHSNRIAVWIVVRLPNGRDRRAGCSFTAIATDQHVAEWARDVVLNETGSYP